jgi:hypothetical protein
VEETADCGKRTGDGGQEPAAEVPAATPHSAICNPQSNGRLYSEKQCVSGGDGETRCQASRSVKRPAAQVKKERGGRNPKTAYNPFQPELAEAEEQAAADAEAEHKREAAWSQGDPCPEQVPLVTKPEVDRAVEICRGRGAVIVDFLRSWKCGRLSAFGTCTQEGPTILEEMAFVPFDSSQPTRLREPLRTVSTPLTSEQRWDVLDELGDVGVAVVDLDGKWHKAGSLVECNLQREGTVIFRVLAHKPLYISPWGDQHRRDRQQEELNRLIDPAGDEAFVRQRQADMWIGGVLSFERE